jgi:hypothetical protein
VYEELKGLCIAPSLALKGDVQDAFVHPWLQADNHFQHILLQVQ